MNTKQDLLRDRRVSLKTVSVTTILVGLLVFGTTYYVLSPATINVYLDDIPASASYVVKTDGTNYWSVKRDGSKPYESTSAYTVIQNTINAMTDGGELFISKGIYDLSTGLTVVGTGTPSLGTGTLSKSWIIKGEGMWSTVLRATAAINIFTFSNALSITLENLYINQNSQNGYPIRGVDTGTSDRSLMRSTFRNLEIHGVNDGYYAMYIQNAYFINTFSQIYIRTVGGGMRFESTGTGYGNQHFENIFISMGGTYDTGLLLRNNGAPYGENTFDRIHIDGGDSGSPTHNLAIDLDGSNYNHFNYLKIEYVQRAVRMGATYSTHGNTIEGGYLYLNEADALAFNLGVNAEQNNIQNVWVSAGSAANPAILIYDNNTDIDKPNAYTDIRGYSSNFAGVGSYIVRVDSDASRLYGQMLWRKAQNTVVSANFRINATNTPNGQNMTITHALAEPPESYYFTIEETSGYAVYDWDAHVIEVFDITATTVKIRLVVTDASATTPSYAHLVCFFDVNG